MTRYLQVLGEWFFFSVLMFTLPFLSYFGSKHLLEEKYPEWVKENSFITTLIPVSTSVITVWTIIAGYAYIAWRDEFRNKERGSVQEDKDK